MGAASNTRGCFSEFVGQRVVGVLFDALPVSRADLRGGTKTLIFEDGRGLLIHANGSFGIVSADEVGRAVRASERELRRVEREISEVLELAGA